MSIVLIGVVLAIATGSLAAIFWRDNKSLKEEVEAARKAHKKQLEQKREQRLNRGNVKFRPISAPAPARPLG